MFDNKYVLWGVIGYFALVSLISIIITVYDKTVSQIQGHRRVPEASLLIWSALGGSVAMYLTMLTIRHKTKHPKFMVGIPVIILIQYGVILYLKTKFFS